MFKDEYKATFSQLTASPDTYRRVMDMANKQQKAPRRSGSWVVKILVAAALISALAVTASAAVRHWFGPYFAEQSGKELSQGQVEYIQKNEKPIAQTQSQDGWDLELVSALSDGKKGLILLRVAAPEGTDLSPMLESTDYFGPSNDFLPKSEDTALRCSAYDVPGMIGNSYSRWVDDGDGQKNTVNMVISVTPDAAMANGDPFGPDAKWQLHLVDLVHWYGEGEASKTDTMAKGTWDFDFTFTYDDTEISLLDKPIRVMANGMPGDKMEDVMTEVTITSVTLRPLGMTIHYGAEEDALDYSRDNVDFEWLDWVDEENHTWHRCYAVTKSGEKIMLRNSGENPVERYKILESMAPLVLEEIDHILMSDGTKIPVPHSK